MEGLRPAENFGETQCRNSWVLNLDADEALSPELKEEIRALLSSAPQHTAYRLNIKILFPGEKMVPTLAPNNWVLRLYDKRKAGFRDSSVHDTVIVREGTSGKLQNIVIHRCFRNLEHWVGKIQFYSTLQAEDFVKKGRKPSNLRLVCEPPLAFLKAYILRRYCFYGMDGFIGSFLYAYGRLLRMAKARELYKKEEHQKYDESQDTSAKSTFRSSLSNMGYA